VGGSLVGGVGGGGWGEGAGGALTFGVDNTGAYTAGGDVTTLDTQAGNLPDVSFSGKSGNIAISDSPATPVLGRGTIQLPPGLFGDFNAADQKFPFLALIYIIDHNQFVTIGYNFGTPSGVMLFDPQ